MLPHGDNIEASGFVQHLKLPHYVTFESELQLIRQLRATHLQATVGDTPAVPIDAAAASASATATAAVATDTDTLTRP